MGIDVCWASCRKRHTLQLEFVVRNLHEDRQGVRSQTSSNWVARQKMPGAISHEKHTMTHEIAGGKSSDLDLQLVHPLLQLSVFLVVRFQLQPLRRDLFRHNPQTEQSNWASMLAASMRGDCTCSTP